jgi:[acyl-carrier-protein] S-malonyltransferase
MTSEPLTPIAGGGPGVPGRALAMFPGQGSQRVSMASDLIRNHPWSAGLVLAEADYVLGLALTEACTRGDAEQLGQTEITQPAIVATSLATFAVLRDEGGFAPSAVAGHSLGEYTALVAAGVLTTADALRLVRRRGELMAGVAPLLAGAMVAIVGLDAGLVEALCARGTELGVVEVANYNEPRQTVISGARDAVADVASAALATGAERAVPLAVSAPFHCSLMRLIEDEFADELDRYPFAEPRVPVLSSVTGRVVRSAAEARSLLRRQLAEPVRWTDVLAEAQRRAVTDYVEVGPGRVLSALANRTIAGCSARSTNDARRIAALLPDARRLAAVS